MKNKHLSKLLLLFIFIFIVSFNTLPMKPLPSITPYGIVEICPEIEVFEIEIKPSLLDFLMSIGFRESGNNYLRVNKYGYLGKYQFGKATLKSLGIKTTTYNFLYSPELQESAMLQLLQHNKKSLDYYIKKYQGKVFRNIFITESGILAAAHLGGAGNVRKFFKHREIFKDGNGTKITTYMEQFSGYELNL